MNTQSEDWENQYNCAMAWLSKALETLRDLNYSVHSCSNCPIWENEYDSTMISCDQCNAYHCLDCAEELECEMEEEEEEEEEE